MKPSIKNIFVLEHSLDQKSNFVPNGVQIGFKMAEKMLIKQRKYFVLIHNTSTSSRDVKVFN